MSEHGPEFKKEAEVSCKRGHRQWVRWEDRHKSKDAPHVPDASCRLCWDGAVPLVFTGKMRLVDGSVG